MSPITACTQWKVPVRLTLTIRSQDSALICSNGSRRDTAALVTRIADRTELAAGGRDRLVDLGPVADVDRNRDRAGRRRP